MSDSLFSSEDVSGKKPIRYASFFWKAVYCGRPVKYEQSKKSSTSTLDTLLCTGKTDILKVFISKQKQGKPAFPAEPAY